MKNYYFLTKPGIIRGNLLTAGAGFLLAAGHQVDIGLLAVMLLGTSLIIASACVCNNYLDRDIDQLMDRTRQRALVSGSISPRNALLFAAVIGIIGSLLLGFLINGLTLAIGLIGFVAYVFVYGYAKRRTVHGTIIGSISGAIPPVAGYTAVSGRIDAAAIILFVILVFWQMPHFYAIAIYRLKDYTAAAIPVLPAVRGIAATKIQMMLYIVGFIISSSLLSIFGYSGPAYLVMALLLGVSWLALGLRGYSTADDGRWARTMFLFSLVVITLLSFSIGIDAAL